MVSFPTARLSPLQRLQPLHRSDKVDGAGRWGGGGGGGECGAESPLYLLEVSENPLEETAFQTF